MSNSAPSLSSTSALRENNSCRGCLWKQQVQGVASTKISSDDSRRTFEYCVLIGVTLISYANYNGFMRGEHPVTIMRIVGASAFNSTSNLSAEAATTTFRMVSFQGTHIYCTAPTPLDCSTWLASIHAGLEVSYANSMPEPPTLKPPVTPQRNSKKGMFRSEAKEALCTSCGRKADIGLITLASPLPQYGYESRCHLCPECLVSQGVWLDVFMRNQLYFAHRHEQESFQQAREECYKALHGERYADVDIHHAGPSTISQANALRDLISNPSFGGYRRLCPTLDKSCSQLELGELDVTEFVELLLDDSQDNELAELKKQAFRVAGDMGSAMKLLTEYAFSGDIGMFTHILDFFLDLCEEGEISSVAFFWPQLQCLHLQMLPPKNSQELLRVEIMEDFLLTVTNKFSVQLTLDLVWGYVADLEDSLFHSNITPAIRRRRFCVLRFVCELESLLFDFQDAWGGGTISLRNMLSPSPDQVAMLKEGMLLLGQSRKGVAQNFLSRSSRMEKLLDTKFSKPPEEAAEDALRAAKHADYFSSHLSFVRRICDITERLRFMEVEDRAPTLQREMDVLNSSGAMGGDPINRASDQQLMRVVRIPPTEGHVFRSKERTPVLLLMEIVSEVDPNLVAEEDRMNGDAEDCDQRNSLKDATSEEEAGNRRGTHYAVDLQMPPEGLGDSSSQIAYDSSHETPEVKEALATDEGAKDDKEMGKAKESESDDENVESTDKSSEPRGQDTQDEGSLRDLVVESGDPVPQSPSAPRALAKFERQESPSLGGSGDLCKVAPETPSKQAMEKLVADVVIQKLNMPDLPEVELEETTETMPKDEESIYESNSGSDTHFSNSKSSSKLNNTLTRKMSALGDADGSNGQVSNDIKRNVLTLIMSQGKKGSHAIAASTASAAQKSLQELDRRRAVEMILKDPDDLNREQNEKASELAELQKQKLIELCGPGAAAELDVNFTHTQSEEDEAMESLRLLLIQNKKAKEKDLTENRSRKKVSSVFNPNATLKADGTIDQSEIIEIDAGDVDQRLAGCGALPPAVLSALTLWKGGIVTTAELLELVKKDLQFLQQGDNPVAAQENSDFWGRFAFGERWAEKKARISATSPQGSVLGWDLQGVIVKTNDDLRQEAFVMQLIELSREAFDMAGLELWIQPYRILSTGRQSGIIECVKNAMSFDALKKRRGYKDGLRGHLERMAEFSPDPVDALKTMQHNFVRSLASYSLLSYLFLVKDRHNGNILLDTAGHVIHIDFGFVFGVAPGGSFSLELSTPFKLTEEMMEVMGGMQSPFFSEFVTLFCCGFLALRSHMDTFLTLVEITCKGSSFKCFEGREASEVVEKLRTRFCPELSKASAVAFAMDVIKQSTQSYGTKQYDFFQYISQGIAA